MDFRFARALFSMPAMMLGACVRSFLTALVFFLFAAAPAAADGFAREALVLEDRWAFTKYEMTDKAQRLQNVQALHLEADALVSRYPDRAEPLVWRAVIYILEAEVHSSGSSLRPLRNARETLLAAAKIDSTVMNGAVHANLGSLYYEVPGWPIAFGDNDKAEEHLRIALVLDPEGRESNYFFGDFLLQRRRPQDAIPYLEKALAVPVSVEHARADKGRHGEVVAAYEKAKARLAR